MNGFAGEEIEGNYEMREAGETRESSTTRLSNALKTGESCKIWHVKN